MRARECWDGQVGHSPEGMGQLLSWQSGMGQILRGCLGLPWPMAFPSIGFLASRNPSAIPWIKAPPFSSSRLVQLVREEMRLAQSRGQAPPVWGAKITGGGSGGTVCILGERRGAREKSWEEQSGRSHLVHLFVWISLDRHICTQCP